MEKTLRDILQQFNIENSIWCKNEEENYLQAVFSIESSDNCEDILEILKENGIGHRLNSNVSVMPCTLHYHGNVDYEDSKFQAENTQNIEESCDKHSSGWNRFLTSVRARLTVAQVVENVKAHAALTFDFIFLILISTIMCAVGLVENSNMYLLSSMLICPMMAIMAGTFGSIIQHRRLRQTGVQNELIGLGIATLVGFCYGAFICVITDKYGNQTWPTTEMLSRGELHSLWVGCLIALLSGAAVALGILSDNIASLVGVAISTSLTPPAVNAGLLWSLSSIYYLKGDETTRYHNLNQTRYYSDNYTVELFCLGIVSICLTFVNIVCIYVAAILVFKIKEVAPMAKDHARHRFWKHDIKIVRDYNKTLEAEEGGCMIAKLSEDLAAYEKLRLNPEQCHHSIDLAKDNHKVNIKRSEFTWSPCMNFTKEISKEKSKEMKDIYENLKKVSLKHSPSFELQLGISIGVENVPPPTAVTVSSVEFGAESQKSRQHASREEKRKFIVTPCETDPLISRADTEI
ncbi:hypothetical protein NQ315_004375 [Exocentrus adspersus]|uniref:DUF389 domain-containing protein n=1 Tax=Exocentrus adspersus TaxID=1586481 RepID=A0AAV8W7K3_9CUCU|nr:hypothetical protein NQ315_004375 [Exocentrus adspersus]